MRIQAPPQSRFGIGTASPFFRSPAWRFEEARRIFTNRMRISNVEDIDEATIRLVTIMRAEAHYSQFPVSADALQRRLIRVDPAAACAYEFSKHTDHLTVHSLDGHLLSEMSIDDIAKRFDVSPDAIQLYNDLFFDVRSRIDNIEYIAGYVIGPVLQSGIESLNTKLLCKYFGYFGGSRVLQTVLYGATSRMFVPSDAEVIGYLESTFERNLMSQTAVTAMFHSPSRFDLRTLIEGFVGIKSIRREAGNTESDWIAGVVNELRKINPIPRGMRASEEFSDTTGLSTEGVIMEPRSAEKIGFLNGDVTSIMAVESYKDESLLGIVTSRRRSDDDQEVKIER